MTELVDFTAPPRRSAVFVIGASVLLISILAIVGFRGAVRSVGNTEIVTLEVVGRDGAAPPAAQLSIAPAVNMARVDRASATGRWRLEAIPVGGLVLHLTEGWRESLDHVRIAVGDVSRRYDAAAVAREWPRVEPSSVERSGEAGLEARAPPPDDFPTKVLPGFGVEALNWAGTGPMLARAFTPALVVALLLAWLAVRTLGADRATRGIGAWLIAARPPAPAQGPAAPATSWLALGLGVVVSGFALLEMAEPYYFVEDDNFTQFLGPILHGCRVLDEGGWPDYNPYQLMGVPLANVGIYGLTYPAMWLACAVAGDGLGLPTATLEVYAAMHLAAGYLACFVLGRRLGLVAPLAMAFGVSFALSGYFLIAGRSWYYMLPVATWLPLLVLSAVVLRSSPRPGRWAFWSGLAIGLFFHAGNAQMWCYGVIAWGAVLGIDWFGGRLNWRRLLWAAAALAFGLAVAAPLLVPQLMFLSGIDRYAAEGNGIWNMLAALFLPYPLVAAEHPNGWGAEFGGRMTQMAYSGTVLTLAGGVAVIAVITAWLRFRLDRDCLIRHRWALLALLALVVALGDAGLAWSALAKLPFFGYFTHPFKLLPYVVLFLNLAGALILGELLRRRPVLLAGLSLAVALLMLYNAAIARASFLSFPDPPYPAPSRAMADTLGAGGSKLGARIVVESYFRDPRVADVLGRNIATAHGVMAIGGYGSMTAFGHEYATLERAVIERPIAARRAYGVRWLVRQNPTRAEVGRAAGYWGEYFMWKFTHPLRAEVSGVAPVVTAKRAQVLDLGPADPVAFPLGRPDRPLVARLIRGKVEVELPPSTAAGEIVLNFLARPRLVPRLDGETLEARADEWGRIVARVPAGGGLLRLDYDAGWIRGGVLSLVLAINALALALVAFMAELWWSGRFRAPVPDEMQP